MNKTLKRVCFAVFITVVCSCSSEMPTAFRWFASIFFLFWGAMPIFMIQKTVSNSLPAETLRQAIEMPLDQKTLILQNGPLGRWFTSNGTADVLFADEICFFEDGTGLINRSSAFSGSEKHSFIWTMRGYGSMELLFQMAKADADAYEDDADDDQYDPYVENVQMEFRMQQTDVGKLEVLAEVGCEGFWNLLSPLRRVDYCHNTKT